MKQDSLTMNTQTRPTFLTVLCILTFIGSTLAIIGGLFALTAEENIMLQGKLMQASRNNGMVTIISSVLTLVGALLMWDLSKTGFWVYVIGAVVSIIFPFILFGGSLFMMVSAFIGVIISIVFVVLYYLNYKHLVN